MIVAVTGHDGFLGRHTCRALEKAGHAVMPVRLPTDQEFAPDVLVHLAARVGGIGYNQEHPWECISHNASLAIMALEAARKWRRPIVAVGSVCAYPKHTPVPFEERSLWDGYPEETNAPYGVAKRLLLELCRASRQPWTYLLPANLYGPGDNYERGAHVIPAMIRKMATAKRTGGGVELWGDGTPSREFLHVADAADAILAAVEAGSTFCPINVGTGVETTIESVARMIAERVGFNGSITWNDERPNGQPRRCLDTTKANRLIWWQSKIALRDGLTETVEDYLCRWH